MIRLLGWILSCTGALSSGEGNRLWTVDVEVRGPCAELRVLAGADGLTTWRGPFLAGEERLLRVPVPVRCPAGSAGLESLPLPEVELVAAGAGASARLLGWSQDQPGEELVRSAASLLARPRPPAPSALRAASRATSPGARLPELSVAGIAAGFLFRFRRRVLLCAGLALGSAVLAFALASSRRSAAQPIVLHELDSGLSLGLLVSASTGELALPREWLEVAPEGLPVEIETSGGAGIVRCPSGELRGLSRSLPASLDARANHWRGLELVWTRSGSGEWSARGPWPLESPLPPPASGAAPPGWLASGLPPGRGILLGRTHAGDTQAGEWVRCFGFEAGD